jgi:phage baseplate assembly protein gpV
MMRIDATSEVPGVTLGNRVEVSGVDKQLEGTYRVIQVTHTCDDSGGYENHFSAVHNMMGSVFSPRTNPDLTPFCESQPAEIVDNNDPEGLGRIKVKMPWQEPKGETTPWIPMVQPHGGGGKGFHFVPEIGEKVFVDFQAGNAEMPIVVGTLNNQSARGGHHVNGNHIKAIQTRSGIKDIYDDAQGSKLSQDASGTAIFMDGQNNMTQTIGNTLIINADKIIFNASQVQFNVSDSLIMNVALKIHIFTATLKQTMSELFHSFSNKTLINSENEIKLESPEMYVAGQKKLFLHSEESAVINSKGKVEMKGESGNSFNNAPTNYAIADKPIDARATVMFRPNTSWKGEFMFDWLRTGSGTNLGQTTLDGDLDYQTLLGYYNNNLSANTFVGDTADANRNGVKDLYEKLIKEYDIYKLMNKLDTAGHAIDYVVPMLTMYKHEKETAKSIAVLQLQIEVEIEPEDLIIEFENEFFDITEYKGTPAATPAILTPATTTVAATPEKPEEKMKQLKITKTVTSGTFNTLDIQVECKKTFTTFKEIKAYTIMADTDPAKTDKVKKLAGVLRVLPNDKTKRKVKKIVLINVKTNIDSNRDIEEGLSPTTVVEQDQKTMIRKFLRQALIDPIFSIETLDLSSKNQPNTTTRDNFNRTYVSSGRIKCYYKHGATVPTGWKDLSDYLYEKLKVQAGNIYENHMRVFYIAHSGYYIESNNLDGPDPLLIGKLGGFTSGTEPKNIVMVADATLPTSAHEVMHSLKLPHTWESKNHINPIFNSVTNPEKNGKHSFKHKSTKNIMDYGDKRYFLYNWQCVVANSHANAEPNNYSPAP